MLCSKDLRLAFAAALMLGSIACAVDQTREAKAPDIDVDMDPGQWPKYKVKWADVDVGTTTRTVTVPKLEWRREQVEVEVPYIDINAPGTTHREEQTISVEVEVPNSGYEIHIREIRAAGDQLWVISELKEMGKGRGGPTRISDRVVVNAPDDLTIRRVIIGQRPDSLDNRQFRFYSDMSAMQERLPTGGGRIIYQKQA